MPQQPYFAYGSNMHPGQLAARCPQSRFLGRAVLADHRFIINLRGYATVVPAVGEAVHGVLATLTPADEATLDRYEGVDCGVYRREFLPVTMEDGTVVAALIYIDSVVAPGCPRPGYLEGVLEGARHHGLPEGVITGIATWGNGREP